MQDIEKLLRSAAKHVADAFEERDRLRGEVYRASEARTRAHSAEKRERDLADRLSRVELAHQQDLNQLRHQEKQIEDLKAEVERRRDWRRNADAMDELRARTSRILALEAENEALRAQIETFKGAA